MQGAKTGGRDFQKGLSGNPKGRPRADIELEFLKRRAKNEVLYCISDTMTMTRDELALVSTDPDSTMCQLMIGSVMSKAIKEGCPARAQFMLNYILGRPKPFDPDEDLEADSNEKKGALATIPSGTLIDLLKTAAAKNEPT